MFIHVPYEASHPIFYCTDHLGPLNCAPTQSTKSNTSEVTTNETGELASIHCNKKEMKEVSIIEKHIMISIDA